MTVTKLPGKDAILAACRGFPQDDHPVLDAAGELTELHRVREQTPWCEISHTDWHRRELIRVIDRWFSAVTPSPSPTARLEGRSIGEVVDLLAELTMHAHIALAHGSDAAFGDAHARLNAMANTYQDLIGDLAGGTRRLPDSDACW